MLSEYLPLLATAPGGIQKLRDLILELAVRGKLVRQDPSDEPARELLERIAQERARLEANGICKKSKVPPLSDDNAESSRLPKGWTLTNLASIALINPRNIADDSAEASFVPMAMIGNRFEGSHQQELRKWGDVKQGFTHFAEGDIGVAKITPCFENSKACVFAGLKNGIGAGTTELHIVRPLAKTLVPRYVLAYLKAPMFLAVGETKMTGTAGQKRLPKDFLESNPFPLPPLAEQHRIVAKVDELMALCDRLETEQADAESAHATLIGTLLDTLTQSINAAELAANWQRLVAHFDTLFTTESSLDTLKQTIRQLAVKGKLVPQDSNDEPVSELRSRMGKERARLETAGVCKKSKPMVPQKEEQPFELPEAWEWLRLAELVSILGDGLHGTPVYSKGSPYFFVNGNNLLNGEIVIKPETKTVSEQEFQKYKKPLSESTILVSINGTLGRVAYYRGEQVILGKSACFFNLLAPINKNYIRLVLESQYFLNYADRKATGTTIKNLGLKAMNEFPLPMPPLAEQNRIVVKVDEMMALCDRLKADLVESRRRQDRLASTLIESILKGF